MTIICDIMHLITNKNCGGNKLNKFPTYAYKVLAQMLGRPESHNYHLQYRTIGIQTKKCFREMLSVKHVPAT
jgi:hypothetical protein